MWSAANALKEWVYTQPGMGEHTVNPVEEGSVGAGTGTQAFGWKGGIGTSSRVLPESLGGYTIGVLVQTNFGGMLRALPIDTLVEILEKYNALHWDKSLPPGR